MYCRALRELLVEEGKKIGCILFQNYLRGSTDGSMYFEGWLQSMRSSMASNLCFLEELRIGCQGRVFGRIALISLDESIAMSS